MKHTRTMLLAVVMIFSTAATAQTTITGGEYWFDGAIDTRQTLTPGTSVDISMLPSGLHTLTMRIKDSNGLWSNQVARTFFIAPEAKEDPSAVTTCEYWLDNEKLSQYTTLNSQAIELGSLQPGLHKLMVRVKNNLGIWSNQMNRIFFIAPEAKEDPSTVTSCEYWLDNEKLSQYTTLNSQAIDLGSLQPGLHKLMVRVKNNLGIWSNQMNRIFFIAPEAKGNASAITSCEYWLDGQIESRQVQNFTPAVIDISSLDAGLHMLTMRIKDDKGVWSNPVARIFYVMQTPAETATITRYLYWMDSDKEHSVTGKIEDESNSMVIDITNLEAGDHTLHWSVADSRGVWSNIASETFTVYPAGIGSIHVKMQDGQWYDLHGRKLNGKPTRSGIYIVNGRKVLVK